MPHALQENFKILGRVLGKINSVMLLTAVFAVIILPIGMLFRLFGNSPLKRRQGSSSWVVRAEESRFDKPF